MAVLTWDQTGARIYETGVDHGVLYVLGTDGAYDDGVAWNGLVSVTESPSGAEANPQYADNIKYVNILSAEQFGATVEAFTYPEEFAQCDGSAVVETGVYVGQQTRKTFGLVYRTLLGNDVSGTDLGYKLHLVYGAVAAPSEKAYTTVNDSPEGVTFSWDVSTTPVTVTGYKATSMLVIDSSKVSSTALTALEELLFGTAGVNARLPLPDEVLALFTGTVTEVTPTKPTNAGNVITIPTVTGVAYQIGGVTRTGSVTITTNTIVTAVPLAGYKFPAVIDNDWLYTYTP